MIKIEVPHPDFTVKFDNIRDIPYNTSGVYVFFDKERIPLYVGQASCLRSRIHAHFTGQTGNNTRRHSWAFHVCQVFAESDQASKNVYECYFINFLKPAFNKNINPNEYRGHNFLLNQADPNNLHPAYCQFVLDNGHQCLLRPHLNRYCHLHGGNGISRQSYIDRAIEDYEKLVEIVQTQNSLQKDT